MAKTIDTNQLVQKFEGRRAFICHEEVCEATRAALLDNDAPAKLAGVGPHRAVYCYHMVWIVAKPGDEPNSVLNEELKKDRGEKCFFYRFVPGMKFAAAGELERRQVNRREAEKDRRLTRKLVWITAGALLLSFVTTGVSCWDRRQRYQEHDAPHRPTPPARASRVETDTRNPGQGERHE